MSAPTNSMRKKLFGGVFLLLIAFAVYICVNLFNTAVVKSEYYRLKANAQQLGDFTIKANRGTIYDTNGKILAKSKTVWTVILAPYEINDNKTTYQTTREAMAEKEYLAAIANGEKATEVSKDIKYNEAEEICKALSEILDMDYDKLKNYCDNPSLKYQIIKTKVDAPEVDKINEFKKEKGIGTYSVYTIEDSMRVYPNDNLAANVIGFTDYDNNGIYGIEAYYDDYLQGIDGRVVMPKNTSMPYEYEMRYDSQNGNNLVLTIDEVLQHYLEKNLATTVSQHKVNNRATGIIMNPKTGAILAMATYPSFNLNSPSTLSDIDTQKLADIREQKVNDTLILNGFAVGTEADLSKEQVEKIDSDIDALHGVMRETQWKNKAITELYFPGSVFKTITCASGLEEGVIDINSTFFCSGAVNVSGTEIGCWNLGGHGTSTLTEALTRSCNPAFMRIGELLGKNKFSDYFEAFGFTQKTGIDLPGEVNSLYLTRNNIGPVELASSSFGQTNKITPLQMITAFAAAVNGGYVVTPYVVDKITDNDGNIIKSTQTTVKRQVISDETSALMREILEDVVEVNGGSNAYIAGYKIGGKSGTSEKLDEFPNDKRYVSTFCAFTPADDPEVIMLVCVDDPLSGTYYGSAVAAPVVSAVFKECLPYLEIYAQFTAEELAMQDTVVPYLKDLTAINAQTKLNSLGLNAKIVGEDLGEKVLYTVPTAGQQISKNGTVVLYMADVDQKTRTVPDVRGMTVEQANTTITNAGLNIRLSGGAIYNDSAKATSQSIEPYTEVPQGTIISVDFVINADGY